MVRRGASLDANWARLELLEEGQHVSTLQLPADHNLSISINAVNLKDRLRNIETNCCDRLHAWLLRIVGASIAPSSMALTRPWRSRPQHQQRKSQRAWFDRCVSIRVLAGVLNDRCPAIDLSQELGLESFRRGFVRRYWLGIDGFKALGQVRVPE